jgi:acyl carrier protein
MSIRSTVISYFTQVAEEQGRRLVPLTEDLALLDSGLDSLCLAIIVARLEYELGIDPFSTDAAEDARFPVTLGDFVRSYENAAK